MPRPFGFTTPAGETAYRAAYDEALKRWPVPYEEVDVPTPFGRTHVIVSGPKQAPPLVLLHGYMATSLMWAPNVADLSREYRVYAIDVMGQPGKSIPENPIRAAADYVTWLTATLTGLRLDRVILVGQSFGGWLALTYSAATRDRVSKLVLLSPGGILPLVNRFTVRAAVMVSFPTRFTVRWFMRWLGIIGAGAEPLLELMDLGLKHFRMPLETARILPTALSDAELRALRMPVLLLLGDREVIYDPRAALARAKRLIPDFAGALVPDCSHDMCFGQREVVDARVLDFLNEAGADRRGPPPAPSADTPVGQTLKRMLRMSPSATT
jgi:pimeloyl-ACP methyl ester carboxylesterase